MSIKLTDDGDESNKPGLEIFQEVIRAIQSLRYGSVEVIVQDAQVVQIEIKKKVRFDKERSQKEK